MRSAPIDVGGRLAELLGTNPPLRHEPTPGGNSPLELLSHAATAIGRGEARVAILAGAEAIHARLRDLARKQGRTLSELVREALVRAYGSGGPDERLDTLKGMQGLWRDRDDVASSREYVRRLRSDTRRKRRSPR